jgi:hypothetical protein
MNSMRYLPGTNVPRFASARTFCPRPAWPLYAMMSAAAESVS